MSNLDLWLLRLFQIGGGITLVCLVVIGAVAFSCKAIDSVLRLFKVQWAVCEWIWYRKEFNAWRATQTPSRPSSWQESRAINAGDAGGRTE